MMDIENKLYTLPEVARFLNVCDTTAWKMAWNGVLPTVKIGKRRMVTPITLKAILSGEMDLGNKN